MTYKSEAQKHIEQLQAALRERDRQDAARTLAEEEAKKEQARRVAELAAQEARDKALEVARRGAWSVYNLDRMADAHEQIDWDKLEHVGDGWPPGHDPSDVMLPSSITVAVAENQAAETIMGRLLKQMRDKDDRLKDINADGR